MTTATIDHVEPEPKQGWLNKLFNKIADTIDFVKADLAQDAKFWGGWNETRREQTIEETALEILNAPQCDNSNEDIAKFAHEYIRLNQESKTSNFFDNGDITAQDIIDMVEKKRGYESPAQEMTFNA